MENFFELKHVDGEEATITELQDAMAKGELSARELVMYYLYRIAQYDQSGPRINAIMEVNPDAIFIAEALDLERKSVGVRSRLHGIPVLLKENIETKDKMRTSAGALALEHHVSAKDSFLVQKLREAGAVILGKTNLTEWANGMSSSMWAGYSTKGGQVLNPYSAHFPGGSSTGSAVAVAANFTTISVGTETSGSILSPSVQNCIVGIKPTVGLISRSGIIPFTYSQDTAGPMARTVADAAILLGALTGRDENDPATWRTPHIQLDYSANLVLDGLKNATIGIYRSASPEQFCDIGEFDEQLFNQAVDELEEAGAKVVENIEIPSFHREWGYSKMGNEFKHSVDNYLQSLPSHLPVHSLSELIAWNEQNAEAALKYGQDQLISQDKLDNPLKNPKYILESITDLYHSQNNGIDYALEKYGLDAILFPAYVGSDISAKAGYPSIAVPAGYQSNGRAFGITFAGTAFSESTLIRIAYAFEQRTKHRRKPSMS
ncbi:MAG: amidase family protein [Paenibacillaceae bacterium]